MGVGAIAISIAAVIITAIYVAYLIVRMALGHEERRMKHKEAMVQNAGGAVLQNHEAEIQKLRSRVAVLERLLTDDDRRVANEISRLGQTTVVRSDTL